MPTQTKMTVHKKRRSVLAWQPRVIKRKAKAASASTKSVTSSATAVGSAGTLSVASWMERKTLPAIRQTPKASRIMCSSGRNSPRRTISNTPQLASSAKAGSSPKAAKNWPKELSWPG